MKTIYEHSVGGDGGMAGAYLDGGNLVVKVSYPIAKLVQPVTDIVDSSVAKLEALIPGDWDKAILEPLKAAAKAEIIALLSE